MEEKVVGQKISLNRCFLLVWGAVLLIVALTLTINILLYTNYQKMQDTALVMMVTATEYADKDFDSSEYTREELCDYFYNYLTYSTINIHKPGTPLYDAYEEYIEAINKSINAAEDILVSAINYPGHWQGRYLFAFNDFYDYMLRSTHISTPSSGQHTYTVYVLVVALCVALVVVLPAHIIYGRNRKKEITFENNCLVCKKSSGKTEEIPIESILKIKKNIAAGVKIKTNNNSFSIALIKNRIDLIEAVLNKMGKNKNGKITGDIYEKIKRLNQLVNANNTTDIYEEIGKLKQLLDSGAITQEEFEKKKNQLLEQ